MTAKEYEIFRVKSIVACFRLVLEKLEVAWEMRERQFRLL